MKKNEMYFNELFFLAEKENTLEISKTGFYKIFPEFERILPGAVLAIGCIALGFNCVSTPSISLEGKNLWILYHIFEV